MGKYYFISYVTKRLGKEIFDCNVIAEHPFSWLKNTLLETNFKTVLVGWQEISEKEYELYNRDEAIADPCHVVVPQTSPLELISHDPSEDLEC